MSTTMQTSADMQAALKVCPDEINGRFIGSHGKISDSARVRCLDLALQIENRNDGSRPRPGDVIIANGYSNHRKEARRYPNGHIEYEREGKLSCCVEPYEPFTFEDATFSTSGGYWFGYEPGELTHVGTRLKTFWTWESRPEADGGVRFLATVHVWEYTDCEKIY